jgi:hypothetical protein
MKIRRRTPADALAWIWLVLSVGFAAYAHAQSPVPAAIPAEARVTTHATGAFDVTLTPQSAADRAEGLGRMSIDKQFHGDLEGTSRGEMLTAGTGVRGSAGYVALERVSGTLHGRRGTFVLQHCGTLTRGAPQLSITVVPDSGTDQLVGLAGTMAITIADGRHSYDFEYTVGNSH